MRRAIKEEQEEDRERVEVSGPAEEIEAEHPEERAMATPCRPSAPPVSDAQEFATSRRMSETPSVTMRRVRSLPFSTSGLVTSPRSADVLMPKTSPMSGSAVTCLASSPAEYAPMPRKAA